MTDLADLAAVHDIVAAGRRETAAHRRSPPTRRGRRRRRHGDDRPGRARLRADRGPPVHPRVGTRRLAAAARRRRDRVAGLPQARADHRRRPDRTHRTASPPTGWLADTLAGKQSLLIVDTNEQADRLSAADPRRPRPPRPRRTSTACRSAGRAPSPGSATSCKAAATAGNCAASTGNRSLPGQPRAVPRPRHPRGRRPDRRADPRPHRATGSSSANAITLPASYVARRPRARLRLHRARRRRPAPSTPPTPSPPHAPAAPRSTSH